MFTSWGPHCAFRLEFLFVCDFWCVFLHMYMCISIFIYVYMCADVWFFFVCVLVFLVLGFFVQIGNSFHMCRNAPGRSNWKWFWFCIFVPLIVRTVISTSGFQRIFRIRDGLHWLCLVLLVISHPLESDFKWISSYYNEAIVILYICDIIFSLWHSYVFWVYSRIIQIFFSWNYLLVSYFAY